MCEVEFGELPVTEKDQKEKDAAEWAWCVYQKALERPGSWARVHRGVVADGSFETTVKPIHDVDMYCLWHSMPQIDTQVKYAVQDKWDFEVWVCVQPTFTNKLKKWWKNRALSNSKD